MSKVNTILKKRQKRVRSQITGTGERPRLTVYRSNRHIYAQIINDQQGKTLAAVTEQALDKKDTKKSKSERAAWLGTLLVEKAKKQKVTQVVFDRGRYAYHGRIKALAEAVRAGGIIF
jgi:large subunit ribosomal protein L18